MLIVMTPVTLDYNLVIHLHFERRKSCPWMKSCLPKSSSEMSSLQVDQRTHVAVVVAVAAVHLSSELVASEVRTGHLKSRLTMKQEHQ